jgi:hypothetical protein
VLRVPLSTVGVSLLVLLVAAFCVVVVLVILSPDVLEVPPVLIPPREEILRLSLVIPNDALFSAVSPAVISLERRIPVENPASLSERRSYLNPILSP